MLFNLIIPHVDVGVTVVGNIRAVEKRIGGDIYFVYKDCDCGAALKKSLCMVKTNPRHLSQKRGLEYDLWE